MKAARPPSSIRLLAALGAILAGVTGCRVLPQAHPPGRHSVTLPSVRPAVLVAITDPESVPALRATGALVAGTARPGERVIVLSARGGALLASSQAPPSPAATVPDPPAEPPHPTSFQRARYEAAAGKYRSAVAQARAALLRKQRGQLRAWAASVTARAAGHQILPSARGMSTGADLGAAASAIASLRQAGLPYGTPVVIAVMGVGQAAVPAPPVPPAGLQASTVVVADFPGDAAGQAAWQSSLVQAGASRAVLLTPATGSQLAAAVRQGLDGAITDTLTSVLFAPGQDTLEPAALPQLRHLLELLAVRYPHATASVDGYTDDRPAPGGNLLLSRRRARQVEQWLTRNGIAAGRLQAFGYGDTDPVAPNTPAGQPLNRRVVVVIDLAVSA